MKKIKKAILVLMTVVLIGIGVVGSLDGICFLWMMNDLQDIIDEKGIGDDESYKVRIYKDELLEWNGSVSNRSNHICISTKISFLE